MKPALRLSITITALSTAGFVFAAAGDPPIDSIDLGSMKLKPRSSAPAAPIGNVGGAVAPAPALIPKSTAAPGSPAPTVIGKSVIAPGAAPAATQSTAAPSPAPAPSQSGIGNVIQSPIAPKKGIDILAAPASSKPAAGEDRSNDVQVRMPSMFRK